MTDTAKPRGRKKATGRYDTREELVDYVCSAYHNGPQNQAQIATAARVSAGVVQKILDGEEGKAWRQAQKEQDA